MRQKVILKNVFEETTVQLQPDKICPQFSQLSEKTQQILSQNNKHFSPIVKVTSRSFKSFIIFHSKIIYKVNTL